MSIASTDALVGHFIPKGNSDELRAVHSQLADRNRDCLNRARAEGRKHFTLWGTHQVYDDDGNLIGHQVYGERRPLAHQERIFKMGREAIVRRTRASRGTSTTPDAGHAPQEATNTRTKGSKRTIGSGSTSSGEDDPPSTEPGSARRCSECGVDITGMRRDALVCRKAKCRKAAQRRREQIWRWYRLPRRNFKARLLPRMRPSDFFEPFVGVADYIDSYGEGGPVNPWLEDHLDHDGGAG